MARKQELRIEVLGPLRLLVGGVDVEVPGTKRRALLALLALARGRPRSVDELLDAVWPDEIPDSGRRALHSHLSRLRGHLGPHADRLVRHEQTYRLDLRPGELDADDPSPTWRGTALEEFADVAPLAAEAAGLAELRLDLVDRALEARLPGDADLVADATRAAAAEPLRERTAIVLVRALAAAGRQADALRAAHEFRSRCVDATGLDPSPAFDEVERTVAAGPAVAARSTTRPSSPFVGRADEVALVHRRLAEHRLVTIVGTGGAGKTRLAKEVAADVGDCVVVELAEHDTPVAALAAALGVQGPTPDAALAAARSVLASRDVVIVLDNCEHVLDPARTLAGDLLAAGPGTRVLATSREPIGSSSEHLVRLGPLVVPAEGEDPTGAPAFDAFLAHARRRDPAYAPDRDEADAIAEVVRRLDGLPLAVELAAGRVEALGVHALRDRLGRALDVLGTDRDGRRHGTLRSTIDWSYRLLGDDERRLLHIVALLPGGFDLATAEHLAAGVGIRGDAAGALARLVDASVVARAGARYHLLETIRAFALEAVDDAGERDAAERAVVAWALDGTAAIATAITGPAEPEADARFRAELTNLIRARDLAIGLDDLAAEVAMAANLQDVVRFRGHPELTSTTGGLEARAAGAPSDLRSAALAAAAQAAWLRGELDDARRLADAALALDPPPHTRARALGTLATVHLFRGDPATACDLFQEGADVSDDPVHSITAALAATYSGDTTIGPIMLERGFALATASGAPSHRAYACYVRGESLAVADPDGAERCYAEAVELARLAGTTFIDGVATVGLVSVWARQGRLADALAGHRGLIDRWRRHANWVQLWTTLRNLASALADAGDAATALLLLVAAESAPEAALVTDGEVGALRERLGAGLGSVEAERVAASVGGLTRDQIVGEALAAVERALAS